MATEVNNNQIPISDTMLSKSNAAKAQNGGDAFAKSLQSNQNTSLSGKGAAGLVTPQSVLSAATAAYTPQMNTLGPMQSQMQAGFSGGMGMSSSNLQGGPALGAGVNALPGSAGTGSAGGSTGTDMTANSAMSNTSGSSNALFDQTKQMQEMQMSFNLQYLQLQNTMQNENRQFTMVSNIMKTKHDTVKNTISNVR